MSSLPITVLSAGWIALLLIAWLSGIGGLVVLAKRDQCLTPAMGLIFGLLHLVLTPLTVVAVKGEFSFPDYYGIHGNWHVVSLDEPSIAFAQFFVLAVLCFTFAMPFLNSPLRRPYSLRAVLVSTEPIQRLLVIIGCLALSKWLVYAIVLGVDGLLLASWLERSELVSNQLGEFFNYLMKFWQANLVAFISCTILLLMFGARGNPTRWALSILWVILVLGVELVLSGNRIYIALLLAALATALLVKRGMKVVLLAFPALPILAFASSVWVYARQTGESIVDSSAGVVSLLEEHASLVVAAVMEVSEGVGAILLLNVVNDFGEKYDYLYGVSYLKIFLAPIPRALFPDKPENLTTVFAKLYEPQHETLSMGATIIGEMYANCGPLTLAGMPLLMVGLLLLGNYLLYTRKVPSLFMAISGFAVSYWLARLTFSDISIVVIFLAILSFLLRIERAVARSTLAPDFPTVSHRDSRVPQSISAQAAH